MKNCLENILPNVQKPARYTGNELNAIHKDWDKVSIKIALAYPDAYEIGMSNLGIQILYYILNQPVDVLAERVFAPWPDFESQLSTVNVPLSTLESGHPLSAFNVLGISLGHELTYTNIVTMLKLGGITVRSAERKENEPLVMAGGPCVFNPEPVADFIDFFVIGEAEEVLLEIIDALRNTHNDSRFARLQTLAALPGVYVPGISKSVKKRYIKDFSSVPYPLSPIVPFIEAVHDRAVLEIMRGCKWGCKFCQAGATGKPVREKKMETLLQQADAIL
ncbi:MAG: B12-binding domain-containing radical SAM protein, partial [Candidatus Margulisiibacteriota bacterium]